jgi:hypothetical protein
MIGKEVLCPSGILKQLYSGTTANVDQQTGHTVIHYWKTAANRRNKPEAWKAEVWKEAKH